MIAISALAWARAMRRASHAALPVREASSGMEFGGVLREPKNNKRSPALQPAIDRRPFSGVIRKEDEI